METRPRIGGLSWAWAGVVASNAAQAIIRRKVGMRGNDGLIAGGAPLQWRVFLTLQHPMTRHWSGAPPALLFASRQRKMACAVHSTPACRRAIDASGDLPCRHHQ